MAPYQDVWVKGRVIRRGQRECARRYEIVARFCAQYRRPFTVLDVGAAQGYFSVRLTEDFPDCTVVAVEPAPSLGQVLAANGEPRVLWLRRSLSQKDMAQLALTEHFDVVLALSVVHWLGAPPNRSIAALQRLGDHLILELAQEREATGQAVVRRTVVPAEARVLGYGASHVHRGAWRPIVLLSRPKGSLHARYLGDCHLAPPLLIESSFAAKTVRRAGGRPRDWHRGITLQTWLHLGGAWPPVERVADLVKSVSPDGPHGEPAPWDLVLQGDAVCVVDATPATPSQRAPSAQRLSGPSGAATSVPFGSQE